MHRAFLVKAKIIKRKVKYSVESSKNITNNFVILALGDFFKWEINDFNDFNHVRQKKIFENYNFFHIESVFNLKASSTFNFQEE